jgi:hypothetical protein
MIFPHGCHVDFYSLFYHFIVILILILKIKLNVIIYIFLCYKPLYRLIVDPSLQPINDISFGMYITCLY